MKRPKRITIQQQQRRALDDGRRGWLCPKCKDLVWLDSARRVDVARVELVCGCGRAFAVAGYGKAWRGT